MSVRAADGRIRLEGDCPVEDADRLLALLQQDEKAVVDLDGCGRVHTAIAQLLLAAGRPVEGTPADAFAREWLLPQLVAGRD